MKTNQYWKKIELFEQKVRFINEYLLMNVFDALPYATSAYISAKNIDVACRLYKKELHVNLYLNMLIRIHSKGYLGTCSEMHLHDHPNGLIVPTIWTSLSNKPKTKFHLCYGTNEIICRASQDRFVWFYGWMPHKTTRKHDESDETRIHA